MEYLIVITIILIYSSILTIIFKKRIEQNIPISVVFMTLIIYLAGMFNNLKLGVILVGAIATIGMFIIFYNLFGEKSKTKEMLKRIFTPGLAVYILLSIVFIVLNKGRICEDLDEFNHWARIVKNMFLYNTYGVNEESIVLFNEYPPFTAIFQYIFLVVKSVYSEDVIITAQCILYLSIIIPITKNIEWKKNLKNLIVIIPSVIFLPIIFYENFYLEILVDGILGIMFAKVIFTAYKEKDIRFKYIEICALLTMLALTKTSGMGLAVLALIIIFIKLIIERKNNINFKKEIRNIAIVMIFVTIITLLWVIKTNDTIKRWDFTGQSTGEIPIEQREEIAKIVINGFIYKKAITYREFTVLIMFLILICTNFIVLKKAKEENDKEYRYYSTAMLISIPIYMIFVLYTYTMLFNYEEAILITSFDRYCSTILLANAMFQLFGLFGFSMKVNIKKVIVMLTVIIAFINYSNINKKYINAENYIAVSNINRDVYTKFRLYANNIEKDSKILFIVGEKTNGQFIQSINEYVSNIKITRSIAGNFKDEQDLENTAQEYDYIFIYRMDSEMKEVVSTLFEGNEVKNDTLYKVIYNDENILLEKVGSN